VRRLAVVALLSAAALTGSSYVRADTPLTPDFEPYTVDPTNQDCVPSTEPGIGATRYCDPINIIFPDQSLASVIARLHAAGWSDGSGTTQWLHYATSTLEPVDWQLGWPDGTDPTQRYHVRLWQVAPDLTIGNVHHEHGSPHQIDMDWDAAEAFLAKPLCSWWCGRLPIPAQADVQQGTTTWRGWRNDAIATVIPVSPPAMPPAQTTLPAPAKPKPKKHKHAKHRKRA